MRSSKVCGLAAFLLGLVTCSGLGSASTLSLHGKVQGGLKPIRNSTVVLLQMGTDYGRSLSQLANTHTNSRGEWTLRRFRCTPANAQLYVTATGGRASGRANPGLELMAVLGPCNSLPKRIRVNEVTTIASVWALDQFMDSSGEEIGAPVTNTTGLSNAVSTVTSKTLVDVTTGLAPTSFPEGLTSPTSKLYTLADIIAQCVRSGVACSSLFAAATPPSGTSPTTTLQAALNIARSPANNAETLFGLAIPNEPFTPSLGSAPHDWMLEVGQSVCGAPAIDAQGNIWLADRPQVNELNTNGVLVRQLGFDGDVFLASAVDGEGNVWLGNAGLGSAEIELNSVGKQIYATPLGSNDKPNPDPQSLAVDGSGNVWAADINRGVTKINTSTSPFGVNDYPSGGINATSVAVDRNNNVWVANLGGGPPSPANVTELNSSGEQIGPSLLSSLLAEAFNVAVDAMGNVWVSNLGGVDFAGVAAPAGVTEINPSTDPPTLTDRTGGILGSPRGIAVDGNSHIWVATDSFDRLVELDPSGAPLPEAKFDLPTRLVPYSIAIDASGNLWISGVIDPNRTDVCGAAEFIGAATPVKTPLIGPPVKP